jgi:hypothetical protein
MLRRERCKSEFVLIERALPGWPAPQPASDPLIRDCD